MVKKIIYLSLALLLPVLVFVGLKKFGKNRFDLPVQHQDQLPAIAAGCGYTYTLPYVVNDSVFAKLSASLPAVLMLDFAGTAEGRAQQVQLERLQGMQGGRELHWVKWRGGMSEFVCIFLVPDGQNAALIDAERRIRGYYNTLSREDMDRLDLELEILSQDKE